MVVDDDGGDVGSEHAGEVRREFSGEGVGTTEEARERWSEGGLDGAEEVGGLTVGFADSVGSAGAGEGMDGWVVACGFVVLVWFCGLVFGRVVPRSMPGRRGEEMVESEDGGRQVGLEFPLLQAKYGGGESVVEIEPIVEGYWLGEKGIILVWTCRVVGEAVYSR